jgi:glycosyltransferase involved in cell wall biosynthesis
VILCVARFVVVKNLALLLHACALLRDRGARFRCVLIGDGPLRQELEAKRAELGLQTIVEMPGATGQDKVAGWWQRAAAGLLTSQNEGMPVCLMEAAASGVPVVATRVGGIPELVEDSVTGFMCAPGDAAGIASALEKLLTDPELNSRIGTAARKQAEARFSLERQVNSLLNLWSALLDGGGA